MGREKSVDAPSLLLPSALGLGEQFRKHGVALGLQVTEVLEEVGLAEQVREALDRICRFERGLFRTATRELSQMMAESQRALIRSRSAS